MKQRVPHLRLSATDLANFASCRHLTLRDRAEAEGRIPGPVKTDPVVELLGERGAEHEAAYVERLRADGRQVVDLNGVPDGAAATERAMRAGAAAIVQATLRDGQWVGRADVLLRTDVRSDLGAWSYEPVDTKLASETRGGTILQLCTYAELLEVAQGRLPERFHVVTPHSEESYRVADYLYYFQWVKRSLGAFVDDNPPLESIYPEPVPHCEICKWRFDCDARRHKDDHLSLVAGISRLQTRELQNAGVPTLEKLATLRLPYQPRRGAPESYARVREQARVQLQGRNERRHVHEVLDLEPERGLLRLPAPSPRDIFLDLEGDPFVAPDGREFLFGLVVDGDYQCHWALDAAEEKAAFERVIDIVAAAWQADPGMHVYHYAPYEPSAFKRLMGRHATREDIIDRMLRAELFVDLYTVVRQGVRASVEQYSIKALEPFFGYSRELDLAQAGTHLRVVQRALELSHRERITPETRAAVEAYNRDDCLAAEKLRDWLESLRAAVASDQPRPVPEEGKPSDGLSERRQRAAQAAARLCEGVPAENRSAEEQARWLLAQLLEFHRREIKAPVWEYHHLSELDEEELFDAREGLAGLTFVGKFGGTAACPIHRYGFPVQETGIKERDTVHSRQPDGVVEIGDVVKIDLRERIIDIKKRGEAATLHPSAVFENKIIGAAKQEESLWRLAEWIADNSVEAPGLHRAARDLLLKLHPRLRNGESLQAIGGETALNTARRLALALDHTVLPIQGPPGSGKTYTGARMIASLLAKGKKVGVTGPSHAVIRNFLEDVVKAMREEGVKARVVQKPEEPTGHPDIKEVDDNPPLRAAIVAGGPVVAGATTWAWARPEFANSVDVLFIDEAGQMMLANALAVAQAAQSMVLLGDPQQLDQPLKGTHPPGAEVSALSHILGEQQTLLPEQGLFLAETWRMAPAVCTFTSEMFYESRLNSRPGLDRQLLCDAGPFNGAGLWFVPVAHDGNRNHSPEEVEAVARVVEKLLAGSWVDKDGVVKRLTAKDILIVAPYNAQVSALADQIRDVKVGTVDRFQGQEAPVVIYSMATSTPEEAPRGMEFLYSLNRLNVATSRARCACILVGNPRLFEVECHTPRQIQLANAYCRYLELAK